MESEMFRSFPDVVTVDELMRMLHIGRNAAYGLLKSGAIKTLRVGKRYIIPKICVISYISSTN